MRLPSIVVGFVIALAACGGPQTSPIVAPTASARGPAYLQSASSDVVVDITTNAYGAFAGAPAAPAIGDIAPVFSLPIATGGTFSLAGAVETGEVAIVFFRGFW